MTNMRYDVTALLFTFQIGQTLVSSAQTFYLSNTKKKNLSSRGRAMTLYVMWKLITSPQLSTIIVNFRFRNVEFLWLQVICAFQDPPNSSCLIALTQQNSQKNVLVLLLTFTHSSWLHKTPFLSWKISVYSTKGRRGLPKFIRFGSSTRP